MAPNDRTNEMESSLKNKRVVILGGSSGIGLAVAQQVVAQQAELVIASSNAQRVQQAVKSLGGNVTGHALDLSDEAAIQAFFGKLGKFDHLVFTAGDTLQLSELASTDLQKARQAFELRYWAPLAAVKFGTPHIRPGG
jgi:NAD(P)-dependent dehydrogenase (short-subunit alcohol dehydrogenase family)